MIHLLCLLPLVLGHQVKKPPEPPKEIHVWVARDVAPSSKIRLNINTRNVRSVHVTATRIDGIYWLTHPKVRDKKPISIGKPSRQFNLTIADKGQRQEGKDNYFARQVNLPPFNPGVYLLTLKGEGQEGWAVVNVTNLDVVIRRSPNKTLVWVTHYKTGAVVPQAEVELYDRKAQLYRRAFTGNDGSALLATRPSEDIAIVKTKDDLAGISTNAVDPDGQLRCLFQTDRPIYRPGQTVGFKAILRRTKGQFYSCVSNRQVLVQLRDPRDNPLDQSTVTTNGQGSLAGSFRIPQEGMLGAYTVTVQDGRDTAYQTLSVQEYRKPEFKVEVKSPSGKHFSGEDLHFAVDASFYFGAPVAQASVHWTMSGTASPYSWSSPEDGWFYGGDGNLYPRDTYESGQFSGEGEVVTDNKGHADVVIHTDKKAPDAHYSINVSVTDSSRRTVGGSASAPVYASALRIGIRSLKEAVAIGDLVPLEIRIADLDGHPRGGKVTLVIVGQRWDSKKDDNVEVRETKQVAVPEGGRLITNVAAFEYGTLQIIASTKDSSGRETSAKTEVQSEAIDYKAPKDDEEPSITVTLDRHSYSPGDKLHAFVQTNRPGKPVLLLLTGGDIWDYKVLFPKKKQTSWSVSTNASESPNAYVSYAQWAENGLMQGNVIVPLPDRTKLLNVNVTSLKKEYRPGEKAGFHVRTTDSTGKGISSEVALAVVDEAIYALGVDSTANPYSFFWGLRGDQVASFSSSPEELSGGAYQRANATAPLRQRFEDTAFWNAFVRTDSTGNADVSFDMPDNLTSWRATARAVTAETRVGVGRSSVTATRPVTLRLATPRIVSQGDRLSLIGTVNNRSGRPIDAVVSLSAKGVRIEGSSEQKLTVPPRGMGTVTWRLNAEEIPPTGKIVLTARTHSGSDPDYADALQVSVPIVPRGVIGTTIAAGTLAKSETLTLDLPTDTLSEGSLVTVRVTGGVQAAVRESADELIRSYRYGTMSAVDTIKASAAIAEQADSDALRESFALLSRDEVPGGWGWWQNAPADSKITAEVAYSLYLAKLHGYKVFPNIVNTAIGACAERYNTTNLWEDRARLAASLKLLGGKDADRLCEEVLDRGMKISPFGKLRLAEALYSTHRDQAQTLLDSVLTLVSDGPSEAYVPVGFGIGWSASQIATTAELLLVLHEMEEQGPLQTKLAKRLLSGGDEEYRSSEDTADVVAALSAYGQEHRDAKAVGEIHLSINGHPYELKHSTVDESASIEIRDSVLVGGANHIDLTREGSGEAMVTVTARTYRPAVGETIHGVRVSRRYESMNEAGVWTEIVGPIKPNEPVRCTVVVWGDEISDALKITEPLPAGFEFVDSELLEGEREEIRDGAVIHYLLNSGAPHYFRYYLRPESDGRLVALPAVAEYLRRPSFTGHSAPAEMVVHP